jgi:LacI family transcriptional regulator
MVINNSPGAASIPQKTKDRVLSAAARLNLQPNFMARSLRKQRTFTIGVVVPEISEGYAALVMDGIEQQLLKEGYLSLVVSHRRRANLLEEYSNLLLGRAVEGIIAVDTECKHPLMVPIVAVSGDSDVRGITNIVLNHPRAATLALKHLYHLGHRQIAFIKGKEFSSDTAVRWNAIVKAARCLSLRIRSNLVVQLEGDQPSPELGYHLTQKLLAGGEPFTALFAFNGISAIGAIRALRAAGFRVPEDVSVVGFDDISSVSVEFAFCETPA